MPSPLQKHWSLDPDTAFLNHGSFGATPRCVLERQASLREEMERNPLQFLWRHLPERLDAARLELATFLHADPGGIAFVPNSTTAVAAMLRSLNVSPGDEILETSHGYNACRNALAVFAKQRGARVVTVSLPFPVSEEEEILSAILTAVTPRTKYALIDHVTSESALILPVKRIIRELAGRGVETLVDGAHAPGMVELDLRALGAAWYAGNLHKWTCAPKGAAFLYTREDMRSETLPAVISHGWNTVREGGSQYQALFDWTGTFDPTAWLCVPDALQFVGSLDPDGWAGVRRRNHTLAMEARAMLRERFQLEAPAPVEMLAAMVTLPFPKEPGMSMLEFRHFAHDRHGVEIPAFAFQGRNWFRFSAHLHNAPEDYERLADLLASL